MATYLKLKPGKEKICPHNQRTTEEREGESGESNKSAAHAAHTCDRKLKGEK